MKRKVGCGKFSLEFNSVRIAAHKERQQGQIHGKSEFHQSFQQKSIGASCQMLRKNFTLSSINKDQLKDLQNYLNQKMITTINTVEGSTLKANLVSSHQVDYMSSAFISAVAVENYQERPVTCS